MTASTLDAWTSCQTICLTHHWASLSSRLQRDGQEICILKFLHFFLWLVRKWLFEWTRKWIHWKSIDASVPGSHQKCCYLCLHVYTSQLGAPTSHTYQQAPTGLGAPTYQQAHTYQWAPTDLGAPIINHGAPIRTTKSSVLSNMSPATQDIRPTLSLILMQRLVSD